MSKSQPVEASKGESAQRLRALAHPLRWKLLDLIRSEGTATVSRCSEVLGESVATCSYHLSILGKYGYLEQLRDQPGRERPWRWVGSGQTLGPEGTDPEDQRASEAAIAAFLDHELERMKARQTPRSQEPAEWAAASAFMGSTMWVTAEELQAVMQDLRAVLMRFGERSEDLEQRPEGAREARVFFSTSVRPE
jgi:helix-turn-helix protein